MPLELMRKKCCHLLDEFKNGGRGEFDTTNQLGIHQGSIRDEDGIGSVGDRWDPMQRS